MKKTFMKSFWHYSVEYCFQELNSSRDGLSSEVVNKLSETFVKKDTFLSKVKNEFPMYFRYYLSPLNIIFAFALIYSLYLGHYRDLLIISIIIIISTLISYFQERKIANIVSNLQNILDLKYFVLRDSKQTQIQRNQIVRGDIILFSAGEMIPCDALIVDDNNLFVDESSITGHNFPVRKHVAILDENTELSNRKNCLWDGSNVISGMCKALVINPPNETIYGKNKYSKKVNPISLFDTGVVSYEYYLLLISIVFSVIYLIFAYLLGRDPFESFVFAFALAAGIAPDLIPMIESISLSIAGTKLLKKGIISRNLQNIQVLGEIDVLCTDKTGTLTKGDIIINSIVDYNGKEDEFAKRLALINARFENGYTNSIDRVLREASFETFNNVQEVLNDKHRNINLNTFEEKLLNFSGRRFQKLSEIPFDFIRKRITVLVNCAEEFYHDPKTISVSELSQSVLMVSKGSFEQILSICNRVRLEDGSIVNIENYKIGITKSFEDFSIGGMRILALCYKAGLSINYDIENELDMIFAGFVLITDPIKEGLTDIFNTLSQQNIQHKIITGDNFTVAKVVAQSIGDYSPRIMTGSEFILLSQDEKDVLVKEIDVFAEMEPNQKEEIVNALKKSYKVGYLGDGINDVSAMRASDVAISIENALDIVRDAADIILLKGGLHEISNAVREGRFSYANSIKYIIIRTSVNFGSMVGIAIGAFTFPYLPMIFVQLFLLNLLTDIPFLAMSNDYVSDDSLMEQDKWSLFNIQRYMVVFGLFIAGYNLVSMWMLHIIFRFTEMQFQSSWFVQLILIEILTIFILRSKNLFIYSKPSLSLLLFSGLAIILALLIPYLPIGEYFEISFVSVSVLIGIFFSILFYSILAGYVKDWYIKKYGF